ncbi:unnamed protein product [Lota lota]
MRRFVSGSGDRFVIQFTPSFPSGGWKQAHAEWLSLVRALPKKTLHPSPPALTRLRPSKFDSPLATDQRQHPSKNLNVVISPDP